ncbi:hypothetical protein D3C75_590220 [compost metagenome]
MCSELCIDIRGSGHREGQILLVEQGRADLLQGVCELFALLVHTVCKLPDKTVIGHAAELFLVRSHVGEIGEQTAGCDFIAFLVQDRFHMRGFPADDFL